MKNVKVLLRENVDELGTIGDVVTVAPGFARNYLLPHRIAVDATPENIKMMERRRVRYLADVQAREVAISSQLESLGKLMLEVTEKADETGTLYGSVGAATIARLLAQAGHALDEKNVRLDEPIKSVGTHEVPIHVHGDHYVGIQIVVRAGS